jgi:hypothetical protein
MASQVYFGNSNKQTWIKSPSSGMNASSKGWGATTELLNGRASVAKSNGSHRVLSPSWVGSLNATDLSESLQTIKDFSDGLYGDGPFYWVDPFAAATNILPPHWAAPMLTEKDWPNLATGLIPEFFTAFTTANNYPIKSVKYTTTDNYESDNKITIIIPTGYKLHFGWHGPIGTSVNIGVRIVPYLRTTGEAVTALNPSKIETGGTVRTNTQINGTTYSKVEIFIATAVASNLNIHAMIAQILPASATVASGGFLSGRGTTALEFSSKPTIEYYSSNINNGQIGMSAEWTEV